MHGIKIWSVGFEGNITNKQSTSASEPLKVIDSVGALRMSSIRLRPLTTTWYLSVEATLKTAFGYWGGSLVIDSMYKRTGLLTFLKPSRITSLPFRR
jgi:hypothetical protein